MDWKDAVRCFHLLAVATFSASLLDVPVILRQNYAS